MKLSRKYRGSLILIALLVASATFGSSALIYGRGNTEFELLSPLTVASICLLVTGIFIALSVLATAIAAVFRVQAAVIAVLLWLSSFAAVAGLLAPLPVGVGMTDLDQYQLSIVNLAISLASATIITLLTFTPVAKIAAWGIAAFCLTSLAQAAATMAMQPVSEANRLALSDKGNILVISFDGLQRDVFEQVMQENAELVDRLNNFTSFRNVASSSPATSASTSAEVLGNMHFKQVAQTQQDLTNLALTQGTPARLAEAGYRVGTYGVYSAYGRPEENLGPLLGKKNSAGDIATLIQNVASRIVGPQVASSSSLEFIATALGSTFADGRQAESDHFLEKVTNHKGPQWDRPLLRSLDAFNRYKDRLSVGGTTPAAHFLHFTFTHHPVDFDEQCQFLSTDQTWYDNNQNRQGLLGEARCSLRLLEDLLEHLDDLRVFDDSLVVIKSDHGAPVPWNDPDILSGQSINGHHEWGVGRYMPILLIKQPAEQHARMSFDDRPVLLDDLAGTICRWAALADCSYYAGANLLDPDDVGPENVWINVVANETSSFRYDDHVSIEIARGKNPAANLHHQVLASRVRPLECDANIRSPSELPVALWREKQTQFIRLKTTECEDLTLILRSASGLSLAVSPNTMNEAKLGTDTLLAEFKSNVEGEFSATIESTAAERWSILGLSTEKKVTNLNTKLAITPDLLLDGWHLPETFGVWSAETAASVLADFDPNALPSEIEVTGRVAVSSNSTNRLKIFVNGILSADLSVDENHHTIAQTVHIPPESFQFTSTAVVTFSLDSVHSPSEHGSPDQRKLGFGLETLTFR